MSSPSSVSPGSSGVTRVIGLWGPVLVVMAVIFFASSLSDLSTLPGDISDKTGHFVGYAALGATVVRAIAGGKLSGVTGPVALLSWGVSLAYGLSDEFHQRFVPGRTPAIDDLAADAAGAATAILVAWCAAVVGRRSRTV